jgi:hypothetical protein
MPILDFTLPGSDPTTPNAFIQTPQQVASRQQAADGMLRSGMDTSPVQSPWQGAARLGQALAGAIGSYQANQARTLGTANADATFGLALGADPGTLNIPATPGQTTPALAASDALGDRLQDAQDGTAAFGPPGPAAMGGLYGLMRPTAGGGASPSLGGLFGWQPQGN